MSYNRYQGRIRQIFAGPQPEALYGTGTHARKICGYKGLSPLFVEISVIATIKDPSFTVKKFFPSAAPHFVLGQKLEMREGKGSKVGEIADANWRGDDWIYKVRFGPGDQTGTSCHQWIAELDLLLRATLV